MIDIPVVSVVAFFDREKNSAAYAAECLAVADALHKFGIVLISDPRVTEHDNSRFLDMLEMYFEGSDGIRDARPEYHYQVGVTPSHVERPRNHCKTIGAYGPEDKPLSICPPEYDSKWRFFWRVGPQPASTNFPVLNMDAVIPPEFPQWKEVMDTWGEKMLDTLFVAAEMAAVGFDMPADTFTSRMKCGPHLLAPTGSNFNEFGREGTVLAGFHNDLNFMTIHGKSRYPGLFVWTRDGRMMSVQVPEGCLLIQAGKQLEYLTGGHVLAGYHEVVVSPYTVEVIERRRKEGKSLWRVSSTCFGHIQSDVLLQPLSPYDTEDARASFPPILAGDQVKEELRVIALDVQPSVTFGLH